MEEDFAAFFSEDCAGRLDLLPADFPAFSVVADSDFTTSLFRAFVVEGLAFGVEVEVALAWLRVALDLVADFESVSVSDPARVVEEEVVAATEAFFLGVEVDVDFFVVPVADVRLADDPDAAFTFFLVLVDPDSPAEDFLAVFPGEEVSPAAVFDV